MKLYTVVLLYPDYLTDDFGSDLYVWSGRASNGESAVEIAQGHAIEDCEKQTGCTEASDFRMILLLLGDIPVIGDATGIKKNEMRKTS